MASIFLLEQKVNDGISRPSTVLTSRPDSFKGAYSVVEEYQGIPEYAAREMKCIEGSREVLREKLSEMIKQNEDGHRGVGRPLASLSACDWKAELTGYLSQLKDVGTGNSRHCPVGCCEKQIEYILEKKKDDWHCDMQADGILACPVYRKEIERTENRIGSLSPPVC